MVEDKLQRPLDAAGQRVRRVGTPAAAGDATFTDNTTVPLADAVDGNPGVSLLAAAADHVHPSLAPMRLVAGGRTTLAQGARVTLATFLRAPNEVFAPAGFAYVTDDVDGATWHKDAAGGAGVATYCERTANRNEVRFRADNASDNAATRTIEWAVVALTFA